MDFFNDIGKRVSDAAKSAQKRAREGAEISKLNSGLRALKDERTRLFTSLGETYYASLDREEGREQIEFIVERLNQLAVREKELQAQIDKISQQKRCKQCGRVVPIEANFCPYCGERIPEEPTPAEGEAVAVEYCPNCGAVKQAYSRFCIVCGRPFEEAASAEPEPEEEAPPVQRIEMEIKWPRAEKTAEPEETEKAEE